MSELVYDDLTDIMKDIENDLSFYELPKSTATVLLGL